MDPETEKISSRIIIKGKLFASYGFASLASFFLFPAVAGLFFLARSRKEGKEGEGMGSQFEEEWCQALQGIA